MRPKTWWWAICLLGFFTGCDSNPNGPGIAPLPPAVAAEEPPSAPTATPAKKGARKPKVTLKGGNTVAPTAKSK